MEIYGIAQFKRNKKYNGEKEKNFGKNFGLLRQSFPKKVKNYPKNNNLVKVVSRNFMNTRIY